MDMLNIITVVLIGIFGGFIPVLVGIGGAIIIYPAILLLPSLLVALVYSAYIASGLTSTQVFFNTLSVSFKARKKAEFSPKLVMNMGGGMVIGSIFGAMLANLFNATFINTIYIIIAIVALLLMFVKVKSVSQEVRFKPVLLILVGFGIGVVSCIVGAGGAFIIIPVLLVLFKLPMNTVVTNSIVIAFISSIGAFIIKFIQGYIPLESAIFLIIGSMLFAPIGLKVGAKVPDTVQKTIVSILIAIAIIQLVF